MENLYDHSMLHVLRKQNVKVLTVLCKTTLLAPLPSKICKYKTGDITHKQLTETTYVLLTKQNLCYKFHIVMNLYRLFVINYDLLIWIQIETYIQVDKYVK